MAIFVAWQLRVTLDSVRNSRDVFEPQFMSEFLNIAIQKIVHSALITNIISSYCICSWFHQWCPEWGEPFWGRWSQLWHSLPLGGFHRCHWLQHLNLLPCFEGLVWHIPETSTHLVEVLISLETETSTRCVDTSGRSLCFQKYLFKKP